MAGSSGDVFRQVREAVDIVDVIAEHLALKRAGKEYKCLCPFHDDHRPSMAVVPTKQIFHCFVCGSGGDVFKFVELYHKMTKGEALRFLAQKAGIKLPDLPGRNGGKRDQEKSIREQIIETNERACGFFEKSLKSEAGKPGLEYLVKRGLIDETLTKWRLGYSPEGWTALVNAASRVGVTGDQLFQAGLAKKRSDGSPYDAFRGRVMFPIQDATGRVIAFGGRVLVEKRDEAGNVVEAKYLNSPETPVFNKSEALYGLHNAKAAIIKSGSVVVVEGYMDVIACHQAGVTNVVATLGTALTPEHARILRRFCNTVVLVFDSDDAGYRAADRAMQTFVREPLDVKIASVPDGKDPCDFCMAHGGEAFGKVVAGAVEMMAYQWRRLQTRFRATESLSAKQAATREFMGFVAAAMSGPTEMDELRRGLLLTRLAEMTGLSVDEVSKLLRKLGQTRTERPVEAKPTAPVLGNQTLTGPEVPEAWVLGALLTEPRLYERIRDGVSLECFTRFRNVAEVVLEYLENASDLAACSLTDFVATVSDPVLVGQAISLQSKVEAGGNAEKLLLDGWRQIQSAAEVMTAEPETPEMELKRLQELQRQKLARGERASPLGPRVPDPVQRSREEFLYGKDYWKRRGPRPKGPGRS